VKGILQLTDHDDAALRGDHGPGHQLAMRIVVRVAEVMRAPRLRSITGAHIDSCLYHGTAGLDFARRLADDGAIVSVPTTLNVSSLDLLHPELYRGDPETATASRLLMAQYEGMGCRPTWTCAPYQLADRPGFGDHVAWAESNAIVFANSVLGARTHRYGDFIDIAAAIVGRVPDAGLHTSEARLGQILVDVAGIPERVRELDVFYPMLGLLIGADVGTRIPVIVGLPPTTTEDQLKAIGSAGASSGSLAMFHAVGCTPEAATLDEAFGGRSPARELTVTMADIRRARDQVTTTTNAPLGAVSLGTPHYSTAQLGRLVELLAGRRVHPDVLVYVSTGRDVLAQADRHGWGGALAEAGVQIVTDTCTYITPVMAEVHGAAITDSAKWAYYAPGNLGLDVVFGSVSDCVESAVAGRIVRDDATWADD
jgi:predicted aconitase